MVLRSRGKCQFLFVNSSLRHQPTKMISAEFFRGDLGHLESKFFESRPMIPFQEHLVNFLVFSCPNNDEMEPRTCEMI